MTLGNKVDQARVGESSRRDARGGADRFSLLREIEALEEEDRRKLARLKAIEGELTRVAGEIRGRTLHRQHYLNLLDEQTNLKSELSQLHVERVDLKARIERLRADCPPAEKADTKGERMIVLLTELLAAQRRTNQLLGELLGQRVGAKGPENKDRAA